MSAYREIGVRIATAAVSAALVVILGAGVFAQRMQVTMTVQANGFIAHGKCFAKKAQPSQCSAQCPKAGDKLVLVTEKGKALKITNPDSARRFLGQKVAISGKIEGSKTDQITLQSVNPAS